MGGGGFSRLYQHAYNLCQCSLGKVTMQWNIQCENSILSPGGRKGGKCCRKKKRAREKRMGTTACMGFEPTTVEGCTNLRFGCSLLNSLLPALKLHYLDCLFSILQYCVSILLANTFYFGVKGESSSPSSSLHAVHLGTTRQISVQTH